MEKVVAYQTADGVIHPSKERAIHAQFTLDFKALYNKHFKVDTVSVHQLAGFVTVSAAELAKLIKSRDMALARLNASVTRKSNKQLKIKG